MNKFFMEPAQFENLFRLYLNGEGSSEEIRILFDYIDNAENQQLVLIQIDQALRDQQQGEILPEKREKEILNAIFNRTPYLKKRPPLKYRWIKIAAAVLIFGSVAFLVLNRSMQNSAQQKLTKRIMVDDVMPGGNRAILTLGDGAQIVLDDAKQGEIGHQGDTRIVKLGDGQISYNKTGADQHKPMYNTMTTPRGGQYKLKLPDGTIAWLNAASSIRYPTDFIGRTREVSTAGEVYFEVARDLEKPFLVRSGNQIIRVLGTHFNINAYGNEEDIKTTLLEGSVKIVQVNSSSADEITIKPNEQASFRNGRFLKTVVDADGAIAWKNGITSFENADIKMIMRQIERWYDVEVAYTTNDVTERLFSGEIPRTATLAQVFKVLELSDIHFKIEGRKVIVSP